MTVNADVTIKGLQEAQRANQRMIAELTPRGALGEAVKVITTKAQRGVIVRAHVDTGAMRAAQTMEIRGLEGRVFTDPTARNPRSGAAPAEYVLFEEERGGGHALYSNTVKEDGPKLAQEGISIIKRGLERASGD